MTTPGYLVGNAVALVVGALHSAPFQGAWSLVEARPVSVDSTELVFAVGTIYPDEPDTRERLHVFISRQPAPA